MRAAGDLVQDLLARGVALWFEGDRLRFRGPQGALTPELRAELGARRDDVLASLRTEAAERETTCDLSYNQRSLWLVHREDPASAAYNVAFSARVVSPVNVAALRQALQALVDRHAILRTTYPVVAGLPVQRIAGNGVAALDVHDVPGIDEDELRRRVEAAYRQPFDLEKGPVLRADLFWLADADHVLLVTAHHIAVDGLSQMQLLDELRSLYAEATGGPAAGLARAETDYADFTRWQSQMLEGPEGRRLVDYWRTQLAEPRARIELPADRRRQARRSTRAATLAVSLDAGLSDGLRQLARNESTTLYVVLLAAFKTLLFRYTGTQDVIVGTPTFGRDRPETTRVVGDFVNTVALRSRLDAGMSLRELLAQVRRTLLDALEAQDCPFPRVVEALHPARDPGRSPLFETMFVLQNFERLRELAPMLMPTASAGSVDFGGLRLRQFALAQQLGQFVLTLEVIDIAGPLALHFKYDADLFDESTIARLAGHLRNVLEGIVADPGGTLGGFALLSGAERLALIEGAGAVVGSDGPAWTLPERFEEQVRRSPEAIALSFAGTQLSYAELNRRANRLAHRLREAGVGREALVGLCCEPSIDLVVGLVAIVKAGGAYVPIDLAYPPDRVAFMLADAKVRVLVTQRGLEARLPGYDGVAIVVDEVLADRPDTDPAPCNAPDDLAYVIYTSGSTGRPKGAMLAHRAVQRLFTATQRWFGFGPDDVWTLFHSVAFDFSVWELWGALLYGGRLVVVPQATTRAPDAFRQLLEDERVTVLNQTPSAFGQLMQADAAIGAARPTSLRYVIFGGEALELQRLRPWFERHGDRKPRLVNMYGITETCVHVTYRPIGLEDLDGAQGSVIGEPIGDLRVHVLDAALEPTPPGVMGEMYVGGPGLARGYLARPDLTAARFVPDPFVPGERLYRTGDLARRRASGELEYLGRIDLQVKIRGFRIELGEIEAVLGRCESVRQSVVVVREDTPGDRRLVAYLVAAGKTDLPAIRARLAEALPAYMVPSAFVPLDALPLTANGKVDGAALPAPQGALAGGERRGALPATDTERMLAGIWAEVLGAEGIGRDDDFFELGGHSLLLVKVHSALRTRLGHDLPMAELFRHTTVAAQAAYLDQPREELTLVSELADLFARLQALDIRLALDGEKLSVNAPRGALTDTLRAEIAGRKDEIKTRLREGGGPAAAAPADEPIATVPRTAAMPVSHMQQRIWFIKQMDPATVAYNMPDGIRMKGRLDVAALERVLADLVARHECLRMRFLSVEGAPRCTIDPDARVRIERVDLGHLAGEAREAALARETAAIAGRPFDLACAPLLHAMLVRLADEEHVFFFVLDHIIGDGLSVGILLREFQALYSAHATGRGACASPLAVQYLDYVEWERGWLARGALDEHRAFWLRRLAGMPPVLALPTDRPRPSMQTAAGARLAVRLPVELAADLKTLARAQQATLFMTLLSAFQVLLYRHSRQADFGVGTAIANRHRAEVEHVIGFFANSIVLRADLSGEPTVSTVIARVRDFALGAYRHQAMPFDMLVDALVRQRELAHTPLFQVMFGLQSEFQTRLELPGLEAEVISSPGTTARFDIALDVFDLDDGLWTFFEYNTDLFDASTIERMAGHYRRLLEGFVARPDARVDDLAMLGDEEVGRLAREGTGAANDVPAAETVHGLFEAQVARSPQAVAVQFEDERLSYGELNARANRLARHLRALGVGAESLVGVWMERTPGMVVALLGILKAGGAYVPLDPAFPKDRIDYMIADAALAAVVTQESLASALPAGVRAVCLDRDAAELAPWPEDDLAGEPAADNLAYVIYTSGSTGRPKGVEIEHRSVVNFLGSMQREPGLGEADRFVSVTTLSFDIAGLEIHGPLTCGGTVVLASRATATDGARLAELLESSGASVLQATPATWRMLLESGWQGRPGLKMLCGGEALPRELAEKLLATRGELWNLYGPTETTIWSTLARVRDASRAIPIGRPIANTQVFVLEPSGLPAPIGVGGELCIGGDGLARGYRNRPELTAEKFVTLDLPGVGRRRLYRTGDIVRFLADGQLEYLGRRDHQVKVRGFRIELGEIEAVLAAHEAVRQCVVLAREASPGDLRLVAYLVYVAGGEPTASEIRGFVRKQLPDYMVPSVFVALEAIPSTPNGKTDRAALPDPFQGTRRAEASAEPPAPGLEQLLAEAWRDALKIERVGAHDNFFELGGHSLLALQVASVVERKTGWRLDPRALFFQSLRQVAAARPGTSP